MTHIDLRIVPAKATSIAVGAGFVALDVVQGRDGDFAVAGGSCGNVLAMLAWMGWSSSPVSRLGSDRAGDFVVEDLCQVGVHDHFLFRESAIQTPIVSQRFVETERGERTHRFSLSCPDCREWLPRFRPITLKQAAEVTQSAVSPKVFYFDRVNPASLRLADWANERGALVLFEPSSVGDERAFQRAVDCCHILKYSNERLGHLPDLAEAKHPKIVIETLGDEGLRVRWRGRWSKLPAFKAPVFEDAAGSGDWCSAGLLHRIGDSGSSTLKTLRKSDLDRALRFGQALAALNCRFEGARGLMGALTREVADRALRSLQVTAERDALPIAPPNERTLPQDLCGSCSGDAARDQTQNQKSA